MTAVQYTHTHTYKHHATDKIELTKINYRSTKITRQ